MDVNLADYVCVTPVHLAATRSAIRVSELLSAGSDMAVLDYQKRSPLYYAARAGNSNMLASLIIRLREESHIALMEQAGCNGGTALHDAVRFGVPKFVRILLDSSADPNLQDY